MDFVFLSRGSCTRRTGSVFFSGVKVSLFSMPDSGCPLLSSIVEPSPSSGEEKEEIPERYEITGYVQRSNPHRATGVTFDDMDMIEKAMASDELTEAEQEQARQTFQKLEGTNMERVLQASVLGSSDKLKRYMRLYVDRGERIP